MHHMDRTVPEVVVRPLLAGDLAEADAIYRLAFGTFMGFSDPASFGAGQDFITTRWRADPSAAFAAEIDGRLAGSNFAANWGSFGFFGPITVRPEYWDRRVAQALLAATMARFDAWGITHRGLFTFPQSPKHIHLYERYGFAAGCLVAMLSRPVAPGNSVTPSCFSKLSATDQTAALAACAGVCAEIHPGLDLGREIRAVAAQGLGDTVLLHDDAGLVGFAVCHCGAATEAGPETCYVKFAAVVSGAHAEQRLDRLVEACDALARAHGATRLIAGVNLGRTRAYQRLRQSGFRTQRLGVAMETLPERGYNRPDVFVLDDWR